MLARFAPFLFVLLWSTGFLGAKLGLPHAAPLAFLLVRYVLVIAVMTAIALASRAPWPNDDRQWFHIGVSGLLLHAFYLGGVFIAIHTGLPAGVTALVVGMQPLLTATVAGRLLGEMVLPRQWAGLALGFIGVALVLSNKLGTGFGREALVPAIVALLAITGGTLYQKKYCPHFDWRSGAVAQFVPTAIVTGIIVFASDDFRIDWTGEFVFALGWLVLVLSIGAISLLNWLIRHGSAVNVASLFYLTPPTTALLAWLLFGETLTGAALAGMALAVWGVYLFAAMTTVRILGIDPGLRVTGFGVIDKTGQKLAYVTSGCIKTRDADSLPERIGTLLAGIGEVIASHGPGESAVEKVFVNVNPQSTLLLGQARGAAISALVGAGLPVAEYTALQVKQAVVGHGKAAKEQVQAMVTRLLLLPGSPSADAADALACAICHAHGGQGLGALATSGFRVRNGRLV